MFKLQKDGLKVLKICHLLAVCLWLGGAVSVLLLNLKNPAATSEGMLYGINTASNLIDIWVIGLGAMGCIITGLLYGFFTAWGFFKHKWIIAKWLLIIIAFISISIFLVPSLESMLHLSHEFGTNALHNSDYLVAKSTHLYWSIFQVALYMILVIISVIKPWGKRNRKINEPK